MVIVGESAATEFVKKARAAYDTTVNVTDTDRASEDDFPDSLFELQEESFADYMKTKYPDTYTTVTAVPDDDITEMNASKGTSYANAFSGCTGLTTVPFIDTSYATTLAGMFKGCTGLTGMAAWSISCKSITSIGAVADILSGTGITKARFENVPESLVSSFTAANLGSQLTIIIVNGLYKGA
jgi:hypothetical protein